MVGQPGDTGQAARGRWTSTEQRVWRPKGLAVMGWGTSELGRDVESPHLTSLRPGGLDLAKVTQRLGPDLESSSLEQLLQCSFCYAMWISQQLVENANCAPLCLNPSVALHVLWDKSGSPKQGTCVL